MSIERFREVQNIYKNIQRLKQAEESNPIVARIIKREEKHIREVPREEILPYAKGILEIRDGLLESLSMGFATQADMEEMQDDIKSAEYIVDLYAEPASIETSFVSARPTVEKTAAPKKEPESKESVAIEILPDGKIRVNGQPIRGFQEPFKKVFGNLIRPDRVGRPRTLTEITVEALGQELTKNERTHFGQGFAAFNKQAGVTVIESKGKTSGRKFWVKRTIKIVYPETVPAKPENVKEKITKITNTPDQEVSGEKPNIEFRFLDNDKVKLGERTVEVSQIERRMLKVLIAHQGSTLRSPEFWREVLGRPIESSAEKQRLIVIRKRLIEKTQIDGKNLITFVSKRVASKYGITDFHIIEEAESDGKIEINDEELSNSMKRNSDMVENNPSKEEMEKQPLTEQEAFFFFTHIGKTNLSEIFERYGYQPPLKEKVDELLEKAYPGPNPKTSTEEQIRQMKRQAFAKLRYLAGTGKLLDYANSLEPEHPLVDLLLQFQIVNDEQGEKFIKFLDDIIDARSSIQVSVNLRTHGGYSVDKVRRTTTTKDGRILDQRDIERDGSIPQEPQETEEPAVKNIVIDLNHAPEDISQSIDSDVNPALSSTSKEGGDRRMADFERKFPDVKTIARDILKTLGGMTKITRPQLEKLLHVRRKHVDRVMGKRGRKLTEFDIATAAKIACVKRLNGNLRNSDMELLESVINEELATVHV